MNKTYKYTLTAHEKKEISFDTGVARLAIANGDGVDGSTTVIMSEITKQHSGDIVSFLDGADAPFADFTVNIVGSQSGSGDPSPTNVRPITVWTGATINVSGEDTSDPATYNISWQSTAGTVYDGILHLTQNSATLTLRYLRYVFNSVTYYGNYGTYQKPLYYVDIPNYDILPVKRIANATQEGLLISNVATKVNDAFSSSMQNNGIRTQDEVIPSRFYMRFDDDPEISNEKPLEVVAELQTPVVYQLTPTEVRSLLGVNNVWADCGPVDVRYFVQSTQPMIDYIDDKTENVVEIFKATDEGGGVYTLDDVTCDELCTYARDHSNIVLKVARYNSGISYDIFILSDYIGTSAVFRHTMITSAIGGGSLLYVRELQADSGNATKVLTQRDINISADS